MLNMILDKSDCSRIAGPCILESHCEHSSCEDPNIDGGDGLVLNFRDIIDEIVPLMNLIESVLIDEPDELRNLTI